MNIQKPLVVKPVTLFTVCLVIGLLIGIPGWFWVNGKGPFQEPPIAKGIDLLADVKYIDPHVSFGRFADFRSSQRFVKREDRHFGGGTGGGGMSNAPGQIIPPPAERPQFALDQNMPSLPPFLRNPQTQGGGDDSRTIQEKGEMAKHEQYLTKSMSSVIVANGFRLLPFISSDQKTVSRASCADIYSLVRTYKSGHLVHFQIETYVSFFVRVNFGIPGILPVERTYPLKSQYVVEEKDAVEAIKNALQEDVQNALQIAGSALIQRVDAETDLLPDPENEPENKSVVPPPPVQATKGTTVTAKPPLHATESSP